VHVPFKCCYLDLHGSIRYRDLFLDTYAPGLLPAVASLIRDVHELPRFVFLRQEGRLRGSLKQAGARPRDGDARLTKLIGGRRSSERR
jgi:hypothetical protein